MHFSCNVKTGGIWDIPDNLVLYWNPHHPPNKGTKIIINLYSVPYLVYPTVKVTVPAVDLGFVKCVVETLVVTVGTTLWEDNHTFPPE